MSEDFIPMFPTKYWARQFRAGIIAEIFAVNRFVAILLMAGYTIHDVINDSVRRQVVREGYKAAMGLEHDLEEEAEERYRHWLQWCVDMGCPVRV